MQITRAMHVRRAADRRQHARRRPLVPGQDALAPLRVVARIGAGGVGRGGRLPFQPGRQARALALAVGARGKPAHARHRRLRRRLRGRVQRVGPIGQVGGAGKNLGHAVAAPRFMGLQEGLEIRDGDGRGAQLEGFDAHPLRLARRVLRQHAVEIAAGQPHVGGALCGGAGQRRQHGCDARGQAGHGGHAAAISARPRPWPVRAGHGSS